MKVYNTLTKEIEKFVPKDDKEVKLYTCGPTVYHFAHIGNLRTYIFEDILEKTLKYLGYKVNRFMNITDLGHLTGDSDYGEDKMSRSAKEQGKTVEEIANFYTEAFYKDMEKLNIRKPENVDFASNQIEKYIEIIEKLLEKGNAYISDGNVYFDVTTFPNYYKLSGREKEDALIGAREDVSEDKSKRNQADFGLWFTNSKFINQIQKYDSPWGEGYPGWHIECSGLSLKYLGDYLDIHCGGVDNIFPHHTNEIAQSESYLGHKWCSYWMHGEHLNDKSGKMSKSKGEFLTLNYIIEKGYNPLAYRYFLLSSHYRKQLVFSYENLDESTNAYNKLKDKTLALEEKGKFDKNSFDKYKNKFKEALSNDLNTSNALTIVYDVLKSKLSDLTKIKLIEDFEKVLSLDLFKKEKIDKEKIKYIEEKIKSRKKAKLDKNYKLADKIREELEKEGITLIDKKDKTIWKLN